jgi:hypothetical protein
VFSLFCFFKKIYSLLNWSFDYSRFGVDHIKNVVHCTDLDEDATLECQYFFDILASRLSS